MPRHRYDTEADRDRGSRARSRSSPLRPDGGSSPKLPSAEQVLAEALAERLGGSRTESRKALRPGNLQWARLDSNQGPTDYESAALTS